MASIIPACLAFLLHRQKGTFADLTKLANAENTTISLATKSTINYQFVADYDRRTFCLQQLDLKLGATNGAGAASPSTPRTSPPGS